MCVPWTIQWSASLYGSDGLFNVWNRTCLASIILFYFIEIKWYDGIILFDKFTKITGYQTGIKVRHDMKIVEFQMNYVPNFIVAKQIIFKIINKFFNSSLKVIGATPS
jgi:hypothetical protein